MPFWLRRDTFESTVTICNGAAIGMYERPAEAPSCALRASNKRPLMPTTLRNLGLFHVISLQTGEVVSETLINLSQDLGIDACMSPIGAPE